jgi:(p)ppGpp synthase/HD superfamily hydrolase
VDLANRAIEIAINAHKGQKDRYGKTYILHPIRVLMRVNSLTDKIVAILHDVVEDSDWTVGQLDQEGFPKEIIDAIDAISRRKEEEYMDYIERVQRNEIAMRVKLADLEDNIDVHRINSVNNKESERLHRYMTAYNILSEKIKKPDFY